MPKGKPGDNPLSDFFIHGTHPFPEDIEELLLQIRNLGRRTGRNATGEHWPFSPREFDRAKGKNLDEARQDLRHLIEMLEQGRGDEILINSRTLRPLAQK